MSLVFVELGRLVGENYPCKLFLSVDPSNRRYKYRFEEDAFVLGHADDTIEFSLVNEIEGATVRIVKHVSTPCEPRGTSRKKVQVKSMNGIALREDDTVTYGADIRQASYAVDLEEHEMLHLGLIVEIRHPNHPDKPALLLCDPQVGNGPPVQPQPLAGTAGTMSR